MLFDGKKLLIWCFLKNSILLDFEINFEKLNKSPKKQGGNWQNSYSDEIFI